MVHARTIGCVLKSRCFSTGAPGLLEDINVLDLTRIIAGPFCTSTLGDLGANVIKVESLDGDESRKWGPPFINGTKDSYYFLSINRNKKSVCIDLKKDDGKKIIYDLVKKCDVFIENFIPGKLEKMGVGYDTLSQLNPGLVYCSITGFGPTGPYSQKPGYDVIAAAMGGLLHCTGERGGPPVKPAVPLTDICTGLYAFGAVATALLHRARTGRGQRVDCSLLATQLSVMINVASNYLNCGVEGERWGTAHANIVPYQAFRTADGHLVLGAGSDAQFADLSALIGRPELADDARFRTNPLRVQHRAELVAIIGEVIEKKTKKQWAEVFRRASFPNGPVNSMREAFEDEHVVATRRVVRLTGAGAGAGAGADAGAGAGAGAVRAVAPPVQYSAGGAAPLRAPPALGEHTRRVLQEFLGYSSAKEPPQPRAVLTLRGRAERRRVGWTDDTVDNEHMNKKKSKCCCIYEKPRRFGESDSEDSEDECDHCYGHVERRRPAPPAAAGCDQDGATTSGPQPSPAPAPPPAPDGPAVAAGPSTS